jgi:AAA15 family ATPase/GTPase
VLLNTSSKVILIDEIENGIHFTKHKELWTKLFQIVGDDIQIFATSHSLEMIKAFNDVAYQTEFEDKAMYFEMARTQKTNKIIANPMDMEILNSEIVTGNSFRGE